MWMNEGDIDDAARRFAQHPVLGPAARTLDNMRDAVNRCSDGWAYWRAPAAAASKLMALIDQGQKWDREKYQRPRTEEPTLAQLKKALTPIKTFITRHPEVPNFEIELPGVKTRRQIEGETREAHQATVGYTTMDDGVHLHCSCGYDTNLGFGAAPQAFVIADDEHYRDALRKVLVPA